MNQVNPFPFTILNREFYESFDAYTPTTELFDVIDPLRKPTDRLMNKGFFTSCMPAGAKMARQGWKIHVSATPQTAERTLRELAPVLIEERVLFKFVADKFLMGVATNKNWPRSGAGKFLTVYPASESHFRRVIRLLRERTRGWDGPYVLSDRAYESSSVIFYRYGTFVDDGTIDSRGDRVSMLTDPTGKMVPDRRLAFYQPPPWAADPFGEQECARRDAFVMLNDRYLIQGVLRHTAKGGIYRARDTKSGQDVVVREARPNVCLVDDGRLDAIGLLQREETILKGLQATRRTPRFRNAFRQWRHAFLVEDYVDAENLHYHVLEKLLQWTYSGTLDTAEFYRWLRRVASLVIDGLRDVHREGIVLRDVTKTNVLLERERALFIDLEFAARFGEPTLVPGGTAGYMSPAQRSRSKASFADDYYALGALLFDCLFLSVQCLALDSASALPMLDDLRACHGLPADIYEAVLGLLDDEESIRWGPRECEAFAKAGACPKASQVTAVSQEEQCHERAVIGHRALELAAAPSLRQEVNATLAKIDEYLDRVADFSRRDRLWPSHWRVFRSNGLSLEFGAAGVAMYELRSSGSVCSRVLDWIVRRTHDTALPSGLYSGMSGVAWLLLLAGPRRRAVELMRRADRSEQVHADADLHYGTAGWGMAHLGFWLVLEEDQHLDAALSAGRRLMQSAKKDSNGHRYWEAVDGSVHYGLHHGATGIGLFLLLLSLATDSPDFLSAACEAMEFDVSRAIANTDKDSLTWQQSDRSSAVSKFPHWRYGSAGVASALLRFHAVTGEKRYLDLAEKCARACVMKMSNKPARDQGLSGFGECFLEMYRFTGREDRWMTLAAHQVRSILLYRLTRGCGVAFPGMELLRVTCDLSTGIAGIGLFLHRFLHPDLPPIFMLDELTEGHLRNQPLALPDSARVVL